MKVLNAKHGLTPITSITQSIRKNRCSGTDTSGCGYRLCLALLSFRSALVKVLEFTRKGPTMMKVDCRNTGKGAQPEKLSCLLQEA